MRVWASIDLERRALAPTRSQAGEAEVRSLSRLRTRVSVRVGASTLARRALTTLASGRGEQIRPLRRDGSAGRASIASAGRASPALPQAGEGGGRRVRARVRVRAGEHASARRPSRPRRRGPCGPALRAEPAGAASGPCRRRWASVARSVPRSNTHSVPGVPCCHSSSRVSGSVATTATRSRGAGHRREVDLHLGVAQRGAPERRLADDVAELGPAARVQVAPVGEQEVELPFRAQRARRAPRSPSTAAAAAADSRRERRRAAARSSSRRRARCRSRRAGARTRSRRCLTWGSVPLCAKTKWRPHSTRLNGCVFSSDARPRVFRRTCAIASSVLIGWLRMNSAIDAGAGRASAPGSCARTCRRRAPAPSRRRGAPSFRRAARIP